MSALGSHCRELCSTFPTIIDCALASHQPECLVSCHGEEERNDAKSQFQEWGHHCDKRDHPILRPLEPKRDMEVFGAVH